MSGQTTAQSTTSGGVITVNCGGEAGLAITLHLDAAGVSTCAAGTPGTNHQMTDGAGNKLCYQLNLTPPGGAASTFTSSANTFAYTTVSGVNPLFQMSGSIVANQAAASGSYTDSLPVDVDY